MTAQQPDPDSEDAPDLEDAQPTDGPRLTGGQKFVLGAAGALMLGTGIAGAVGTYTNVSVEFGRAATALGVVAGGEGVTLILALVMLGLTMLGQPSPAPVRAGLWGAPIAAAVTCLVVADTVTEAVVYSITPMAMCVAAEGLGLLARRIVTHRTGIDMEALRRNARTMQRLAYHRARAAKHPSERVRWYSERVSWRLARQVGVGDAQLGAHLVTVQRGRLGQGADNALADMLGLTEAPALQPGQDTERDTETPALEAERDTRDSETPGTETGQQDSGQDSPVPAGAARPEPELLHRAPIPAVPVEQQIADRAALVLTASPDPQDSRDTPVPAPRTAVSRPAQEREEQVLPAALPPRPPQNTPPSVKDTVVDAIYDGVGENDRDVLRARVQAVHGDVPAGTFRKSRTRAIDAILKAAAEHGTGFYA
ncbi:hypothetical protein [Streptomyces barkulensis]|uniref:hypothetical protein n=1 Tax=Streptomyces barkulensis TaxID=1257026 RepID=UPI000C6DACCB|nr:hypothetical protein [Streptomyces barkulensis]